MRGRRSRAGRVPMSPSPAASAPFSRVPGARETILSPRRDGQPEDLGGGTMMRAAAVSALALLFAPAGASRSAVSEAIKVDQVGYLPTRPKLAMITDARAAGAFRVRRVR